MNLFVHSTNHSRAEVRNVTKSCCTAPLRDFRALLRDRNNRSDGARIHNMLSSMAIKGFVIRSTQFTFGNVEPRIGGATQIQESQGAEIFYQVVLLD